MTKEQQLNRQVEKHLKHYTRALNRLYKPGGNTAAIIADIEISALLFNESYTQLRSISKTHTYPEYIAL